MVVIDVSTILTSFRLFFGQNYCSFAEQKSHFVSHSFMFSLLMSEITNRHCCDFSTIFELLLIVIEPDAQYKSSKFFLIRLCSNNGKIFK